MDKTILRQRIFEAAIWTKHLLSHGSGVNKLWLEELQPSVFKSHETPASRIGDTLSLYTSASHEVNKRRRELIGRYSLLSMPLPSPASEGSLLLFDPFSSMYDELAMHASENFFNQDNTPPWATWVGFFDRNYLGVDLCISGTSFLLAWIPTEFRNLADQGVKVDPGNSLIWFERAIASAAT